MFIDSSLEFADGATVPLTADAATENFLSIGEIDLRPAGEDSDAVTPKTVDFSAGEPLYLVVEVDTAITGTTTSYAFALFTDNVTTADDAQSSGTKLLDTGLQAAYIAAGTRLIFALPNGGYERYLTLHGKAASNSVTVTGGTVSAFITKDVSNWTSTATRVPATDPGN